MSISVSSEQHKVKIPVKPTIRLTLYISVPYKEEKWTYLLSYRHIIQTDAVNAKLSLLSKYPQNHLKYQHKTVRIHSEYQVQMVYQQLAQATVTSRSETIKQFWEKYWSIEKRKIWINAQMQRSFPAHWILKQTSPYSMQKSSKKYKRTSYNNTLCYNTHSSIM